MANRQVQLSGHGSLQLWGMSPAQNLLNFIKEKAGSSRKDINVFLFGESDLRHSMKTLASNWEELQANEIHLHLYVLENSLDLYARQMVLWSLALEALEEKGLYDKTIQFMDLFGNLHIRPRTKSYLLATAEKLIKLITDDEKMMQEFSMFDFSLLKYRERDQLVEIYKFWSKNSDPTKSNLAQLWDIRLRQYLDTRYDSRIGVFDWDYNMNLLEKGRNVGIISIHEYKTWRNTGLAFGEYEDDYSQPNLTLTTGASTPNHNYWGDILTGPFISHGIECENVAMFTKANHKFNNKCFEITQHNLEKMLTTISSPTAQARLECLEKNAFTIHFVSPSNLNKMIQNGRFKEYFDLVYLANSMVQYLATERLKNIFSPDCVVVVENASFVLELRPEQTKLFDDKVVEIAKTAGFEMIVSESDDNDKTVDVEADEDEGISAAICRGDNNMKYFQRYRKMEEQLVSESVSVSEA